MRCIHDAPLLGVACRAKPENLVGLEEPGRPTRTFAAAILAVSAVLLLPVGFILRPSVAGAPAASGFSVTPDTLSDSVSATSASFRIDESGAATYSIPLFTAPGTAGVVPKLSLNYSSQGGAGPIGKGWSIGGMSAISRCRATRESGDFISGGVPVDGNPSPINFTVSDRYCLDGQRLIPAAVGCATVGGMTAEGFYTEIQSYQRICAYTPSGGVASVAFFTVERKDGSISWYGDRDSSGASNRADGYVNSTSPGKEAFAVAWAQTRFQDSTGNYIDYLYLEGADGAAGEHLLSSVRYTGRVQLPGQVTVAKSTYAKIDFTYGIRPSAQQAKGYASGGVVTQAHRLSSIQSSSDGISLRHYALTYAVSASGSGLDTLASIQECRDGTLAVCSAPTQFTWSGARHEFATKEYPANLPFGDIQKWKGFKQGDVDGDGRPDIVYIKEGSSGESCPAEYILTAFSTIDSSGRPSYVLGPVQCTTPPGNVGISQRGDGGWHLFDYNGDGRDDLFISSPVGQGWRLYLSTGRGTAKVFDDGNNVISSLSPAIPSYEGSEYQVQRADLNGDGLVDVIYASNGLKARLSERQGTGFSFGPERTIILDSTISCTTCLARSTVNWPGAGSVQSYDLNGDGGSDLLMQTTLNKELFGDGDYRNEWYLEAFSISEITPTSIRLKTHTSFLQKYFQKINGITSSYTYFSSSKFADFNSDGLTDVLYKNLSNDWSYRLNTGTGFAPAVFIGQIPYSQHLQTIDVNGDARSDIVYVDTAYSAGAESGKKYFARLAQPDGTISSASVEMGGNALLCEGYNCDPNLKMPMFGDLDGDGNLDFMSLKLANNPDLFISRAVDRYVPRDTIVKFTDGYGAETEIAYAPLTLKDFYRPDVGSRNATNWGRGSPVQDMLAPMYAAYKVGSTVASNADPSAKALVHYRYNGAKMQAGGRGFLGFREVLTIDPNQTGGYVTTQTLYAQNFPFLGLPLQTNKFAAINMVYVPSGCIGNAAPPENCFAPSGQAGAAPVGTSFSQSQQVWEAIADAGSGFQPGIQTAILPFTSGTQDTAADPFSAMQTSRVVTTFTHASYGNIGQTSVDTYAGTSTTPMSTVVTSNTYTDDVSRWRLGRLTASTVTHQRPGMANIVRTSSFTYDMGGPGTGLMTEERRQPNTNVWEDLRNAYSLDDFGNRVASFICTQQVADCRSTNIQFSMWDWSRIHRYARQEYDANGRFPTRRIELFRPTGASDINAVPVEAVSEEVLQRDDFGNVIEAVGLNGVRSVARYGSLGRDYYAWKQTDPAGTVPNAAGTVGVSTLTTYRWCGSSGGAVACPASARFRAKTTGTGAPTVWIYYDVLGREVLKVGQSFNTGVSDKDASGVCTIYDAVGRPWRVSSPFFLPGTTSSGEPSSLAAVCSDAGRQWTTTDFDILGRPVRVVEPNGATSTIVYNGLTVTKTNARNFAKVEVKNAVGELLWANDAAGARTDYIYDAAGNLQSVSRDAGRGAIVTWMGYDASGRNTYINDPDSGERYMKYNALGELLLTQTNGAATGSQQRYDFKGRVQWRGSWFLKADGSMQWDHSAFTDYDTAANGYGQENCSNTENYAYVTWVGQSDKTQVWSRCNTYDSMGRPLGSATAIDGVTYSAAIVYDEFGRTARALDPSGKWLKTEYGGRGFALRICESSATDSASGCAAGVATTYLDNQESDPFGNIVQDIRGGSAAMRSWKQYDAQTGRLNEICVGSTSSACQIMHDRYVWDGVGNMVWRDRKDYGEDFWYDSVDRFEISRVNRVGATTYGYGAGQVTDWTVYDKIGNVCAHYMKGTTPTGYYYAGRAGCGLPGYSGAVLNTSQTQSPHQVLKTSLYNNYVYDDRGNQTFADSASSDSEDRTIRYNSKNQAYEVFKGIDGSANRLARFWYDPSGNRYKREDTGLGIVGTRRTIYVGNIEIVTENGTTTYKRYIAGVLVQNVINGIAANRYLYTDHLGSIVSATNENGAILEGGGFNAFGERRSNGGTAVSYDGFESTNRGFTGHEMLDGLDVIHMNGRIYDPTLGRFLQADPVVQQVGNPQNWNAYTYVFNNPYRYIDPTGAMSQGLRQVLGIAIAVAGSILMPYATTFWAKFGLAVAAGFVSGYVATGSLQGAVYGAFSAAVFFGISQAFNSVAQTNAMVNEAADEWLGAPIIDTFGNTGLTFTQFSGKVVTTGMAGGVVSMVQGGKFGCGFLSAGLVEATAPGLESIKNPAERVTASALLGGTVSEISGGKFASGAGSAAMLTALREVPGYYKRAVGYDLDIRPGKGFYPKDQLTPPQKGYDNIGAQGNSDPYDNPGLWDEGGRVSKALNYVPGINAVGGLHDAWQIRNGVGLRRELLNVPLMLPAAVVTYAGFAGVPLTFLDTRQLMYLSASHSARKEVRSGFYGAAAAM